MWTVDHEADIASDLSAFHRVDDPLALDGPRYFSLAQRVGAYRGVMHAIYTARAQREHESQNGGTSAAPGRTSASSAPAKVAEDVALAQLSDGWVEHVKEGA